MYHKPNGDIIVYLKSSLYSWMCKICKLKFSSSVLFKKRRCGKLKQKDLNVKNNMIGFIFNHVELQERVGEVISQSKHHINSYWVLINSQSTIDLFCNDNLLTNIWKILSPLTFIVIQFTQQPIWLVRSMGMLQYDIMQK